MKKLIIVALIVLGAWNHYTKTYNFSSIFGSDSASSVDDSKHQPLLIKEMASERKSYSDRLGNFKCDGRQYCSQMNSRAEAEFFSASCPNTKMDGDRDGIPCENDSRF